MPWPVRPNATIYDPTVHKVLCMFLLSISMALTSCSIYNLHCYDLPFLLPLVCFVQSSSGLMATHCIIWSYMFWFLYVIRSIRLQDQCTKSEPAWRGPAPISWLGALTLKGKERLRKRRMMTPPMNPPSPPTNLDLSWGPRTVPDRPVTVTQKW